MYRQRKAEQPPTTTDYATTTTIYNPYIQGEGELKVILELDAPTDTTATEAVNEGGSANKVVGRADDNRGDRRATETEKSRDSDVAANERT